MLGFNRSPEEIIFQVEYEDAYREGYRLGYKQGIERILVNILEYGIDLVTISKISKVDLDIILNLKNRNNL